MLTTRIQLCVFLLTFCHEIIFSESKYDFRKRQENEILKWNQRFFLLSRHEEHACVCMRLPQIQSNEKKMSVIKATSVT